jgi:hypothetical protein
MMTLLMNYGNDPPVLSARRSCSFVERPFMKRHFFSFVSTCSIWLNNYVVVVHGPSALLQVHELLVLPTHYAYWDVMGMESVAELSPWYLVVHGTSGSVVGPPCASVSP